MRPRRPGIASSQSSAGFRNHGRSTKKPSSLLHAPVAAIVHTEFRYMLLIFADSSSQSELSSSSG
jgi:hypothetical protein